MNKYILIIPFLMVNMSMAVANNQSVPDMNQDVCKLLAEYQGEEDVTSADYTAGVDVHGDPVIEADLSPSPVTVPENFEFDITVDIAKYTNMNVPAGVEGQGIIGTVRMTDGKLYFNDSPLEGQTIAALRALCDENTKEKSIEYNE